MDSIFELRFTARQLAMQAKRSDKQLRKEKIKLKKAMEAGRTELYQVIAQSAIREREQARRYRELSARIEGVAARMQQAAHVKSVTRTLAVVATGMKRSMETMNLEQISRVMAEFEKQIEDMDVQTATIEATMDETTATSAPSADVQDLIAIVAEENGLELGEQLSTLTPSKRRPVQRQEEDEADRLAKRLTALKSPSQ